MNVVKFERFTDPLFLRQIGRPLLDRFLSRFSTALAGKNVLLPPPGTLDQDYFNLLAHLLMAPDKLPAEMNEALQTISELANPEGQQRLEQTLEQTGASIELDADSSHGDIALQVWLRDPSILARARNLHRLTRFCTFHHFGPAEGAHASQVSLENLEVVSCAQAECDEWFSRHNRGRNNTRIELYLLPESGFEQSCEYWFLIMHGETFSRTPKVEKGKLDVLHFRPARDDVVVYNPRRRELRINARTSGERELYRAAFGQSLFRDRTFFSVRKAYTLAPLRQDGPDALDVRGINGLEKVCLRDFELSTPDAFAQRVIRKATDIFAAAEHYCITPSIPERGCLTRATFEVHFIGRKLPRVVQVRPPNTMRISRNTDVRPIEEWLTLRGFRISNGNHAENSASKS